MMKLLLAIGNKVVVVMTKTIEMIAILLLMAS